MHMNSNLSNQHISDTKITMICCPGSMILLLHLYYYNVPNMNNIHTSGLAIHKYKIYWDQIREYSISFKRCMF